MIFSICIRQSIYCDRVTFLLNIQTMDKLIHSLKPLNWNLSMSGCPIIPYKSKPVNVFLKLHAIILIILTVWNFKLDVSVVSDVPLVVQVLMYFWNLQHYTCSISFITIVWTARQSLQLLLKELSEYLTDKDYKKIRIYSACLLVYKALHLSIMRALLVFLLIWQRSSQGVTWIVMLHYVYIHDWFTSGLSLYLALLKVIHLAEANIVTELTENVQEKSSKDIYNKVRKIIEFKENFSRQVTIPVCFMFVTAFVTTVGNVCRFQITYYNHNISKSHRIYSLLTLGRMVVALLRVTFLVLMTHKWSRESQEKLVLLSATIVNSRYTCQWQPTLDIIKVAQEYKYRAADFFVIDRKMLLSFVSSFISLSVLFIQLINQGFQ